MTSGETDVGSMERHYRVTPDSRLLLRQITPEVCRGNFFFNE